MSSNVCLVAYIPTPPLPPPPISNTGTPCTIGSTGGFGLNDMVFMAPLPVSTTICRTLPINTYKRTPVVAFRRHNPNLFRPFTFLRDSPCLIFVLPAVFPAAFFSVAGLGCLGCIRYVGLAIRACPGFTFWPFSLPSFQGYPSMAFLCTLLRTGQFIVRNSRKRL